MSMSPPPAGSIAFFAVLFVAQCALQVSKNNKLIGLSTATLSLLAWDPARVNKADYVLALGLSVLAHQFYVRTTQQRKSFKVRINRRRLRQEHVQTYPVAPNC